MRKEFVYSMLAVTVAPGAALAAKVNVNIPTAQQISDSKWTGDPTVSEGTVLVAAGASISQNIGTLLPGTYKLDIAKLVSVDCDLLVNFAGQTQNIKKASTNASLTFTLSVEQDVDLTITSADAQSFEVNTVTLQLVYDFDASYAIFNDANVKVISLISQITNKYGKDVEGQTALLSRAQVIQKKIDDIKNKQDYATYEQYALYGDDALNDIMNEINALRSDAAKAVNKWYVEQLNAKLGEVYDGQNNDVKAIVKSAYETIKGEIDTFDNNDVADDTEYEALLAKIDNGNDADDKDLKDKIRLAKDTAANLLDAYNDVKAYINGTDAYASQWAQSDGLTYGSAYDIYTDINAQLQELLKDAKYKNILDAAQKALSHALQKVTQAEKDNEAAYAALSYKLGDAEFGLQAKLKTDVAAAVQEMKDFVATYTATKAQFDALLTRYNTVNDYLTSVKNTHKVGLEVSQIKSALTKAQNAVDALKAAFDNANVATSAGVIEDTMADLYNDATSPKFTDLETAANDAIAALNTTAAPYTAHQNAISNANSQKSTLDSNWSKAKGDAGKYNYDSDLVSGYFSATISAIEKSISDLNTAINNAKNSGKWSNGVYSYNTGFYASTLATTISSIQGTYNTYKTEAKAAQDNYNAVVNSNNGMKKLQTALNEADSKVKDLAIYNDITYNYAKKVVDIQAKIDAVWQQINDAKKLKDYKHSDAMKAVTLDATIATDIQAILDGYEADNATLEAALKAAMLTATAESYDKLVDDINSLDGDQVKYGLSYDAIDAGRTSIKSEEADKLFTLDKAAAKAAIDAADSKKLAEIQEAIQDIRVKLDELLAVAEQAAKLVKDNQDAQAELVKAIYDGAPGSNAAGNLDKYYADKITNDALVNNATALADESVSPVKAVNKEMKTDIVKAINDLKAAVGTDNTSGTDRVAEKLAENKAKHQATIENIKKRIDAALQKAKDVTANYNKYQEYIAATTGKIDVMQAALDAAVAKANTADAANADYKDQGIVKTQQNNLNSAKSNANNYYKNGTMVSNASKVQELLDKVKNFADGLEAKAKDNKSEYDKIVAEWKAVKTLWTTVSTDIAKYDESSKREGFQQQLKALLDDLNQNKTGYEAKYKAIGLPDNDLTAKLAKIKSDIEAIRSQSLDEDNYKANIKDDNDHMLEVIKAAVADAAKEYDLDTDTLKMFKNVTSTVLTTSLATVQTQYDILNDALYKYAKINSTDKDPSTFVQVVNAKYNNAVAEYGNTVSPAVFDKDSSYVFDIRNDIQQLVSARESFMTAIRAAIASETSSMISGYQTQINNVVAELKALNGYEGKKINDATAKSAVQTQTDNLAAAKDAVAAGLIPEIDNAFAKLQNLTADLATAKYNAMRTKLDADIKLAEAYVAEGKDYLADDAANLASFNSEAANVTNARNQYNSANSASKLTDTKFNQIEALIAEFKANGNNTYATTKANNEAWPTIQGYVAASLNKVQNAINGIKEYAVAGQIQTILEDNYRTIINEKYDSYEQQYQAGQLKGSDAKSAKTTFDNANSRIDDVVKNSNNSSVLYLYEADVIKANLAELEAEYNKFAASDLTDITESEKVKAEIESIKSGLGDYSTQTKSYNDANGSSKSYTGGKWSKKSKASDLLAVQKKIAELLNTLLTANYGEGTNDAAALADLQNDFAAVKAAFNKANYTDEELAYAAGQFEDGSSFTNVDLSDEIAQLEAAISAIEADLAGSNVYYNRESIADKIAAALKQAQTVKAQAEANKANLNKVKAEFNAAYDKLLTKTGQTPKSIADLNNVIKSAKSELDKNIYDVAKSASFANMFSVLEQKVADQKSAIETAKANGVLQTSGSFNTLKTNLQYTGDEIVETLYDIKNTAANRELVAQVADLQAQLDAIDYDAEQYTLAVQKTLAQKKAAIDAAINGTFDASGNLTANGVVQEIAAAKMQDYVLNASGVAVDPTTSATVTTSYVYLTTNGINKSSGKLASIKKQIDDLKSEIVGDLIDPNQPADFNGDGKISVQDYTLLLNAVLDSSTDSTFDLNGDGDVSVADIVTWVNIYRGNTAAAARATFNSNDDTAAFSVVSTNEGITRLAINLNSLGAYSAMQLDAANANIVGVSLGERAQEMDIFRRTAANGNTRIVVSSMFGKEIAASEGAVIYIDVANYNGISFGEAQFVNAAGQLVTFDLATGAPTSIDGMAVEQSFTQKVYNMAGKLMNGLKKGINIIRNSDGSTKKVVVK